jgi:hypothetical protein
MVNELILLLGLAQPDMTGPVAVEAAYVLQTTSPVEGKKCCGLCKNGKVTHGDGHVTDCACPADCKCKTKGAVIHPPSILKPACQSCVTPTR